MTFANLHTLFENSDEEDDKEKTVWSSCVGCGAVAVPNGAICPECLLLLFDEVLPDAPIWSTDRKNLNE